MTPEPSTRHLRAAMLYAQLGYFVFPAHEPIFDKAGRCVGCTCEAYKRSEKYHEVLIAQRRERDFDPNYVCPQPGKCPRVKWREASTIDENQIRQWWQWWPNANIGIDTGKSRMLAFDQDSYKENYEGGGVDLDTETVTSLTGGGGTHLWYRMPAGAEYGNGKGDLPAGIDIRGVGGYVIVPPSVHKSGRRYEFEIGYDPLSIELAPLPPALIAILDGAQHKQATHKTVFTTTTTEPPDLSRWCLSDKVRTLIDAPPVRGERSEADARVCTALVYAGATDDDILAVFQHHAIGTHGKYAERGDDYLSRTIARARTFVAEHPPTAPPVPASDVWAEITTWRSLAHDTDWRMLKVPTRRINTLIAVLDAVLDFATEQATLRPIVSLRQLALRAGKGSAATALATLQTLAGLCVCVATDAKHGGTLIHLASTETFALRLNTDKGGVYHVQSQRETPHATFTANKMDDPFLSGTSRWAKQNLDRPEDAEQLRQWLAVTAGLGVMALRIIDLLSDGGDYKAADVAEALHVANVGSVRRYLKRLADVSILAVETEQGDTGRPVNVYEISPEWRVVVETLRPTLRTHMLAVERSAKAERDIIDWLAERAAIEEQRNIEASAEEVKRRNRRRVRAQNALAGYLQVIDDTLSADEAHELAGQPSQRRRLIAESKRQRRTEDARVDLAAQRRAEEWDATKALVEAVSTLKADKQPKNDWARQLELAGWTPSEAARAVRW